MTDRDDISVEYYVVCVLDLLGQRNELAKWPKLSLDGKTSPELIAALRSTVGKVSAFRKTFEGYFDLFAKETMPKQKLESLAPEHRALYHRFKDCELHFRQFADTFLFYAKMTNSAGDLSTIPLYSILGACCLGLTFSLANEAPVRGGLCIGAGAELDDCQRTFYGPAMAIAHHLETEIAGYPRIVVAPEVVSFLRSKGAYSDREFIDDLMKSTAKRCLSYLCEDKDGITIVDFLGRGFHKTVAPVAGEEAELYSKARDFVANELNRHGQSGDAKLATRYYLLHQYVESRFPLWDQQETGKNP